MPPINTQPHKESLSESLPEISHGTDEQKQLRFSVAILLVINVLVVIGYAFLFGFILQTKDSIVASVSKLDTEQLREQQLKILRDGFQKTERKREALDTYFINSQEIVSFIEEIEEASRYANVALEFNFVNIRDTETGGALVLEFETFGSFREIFYFLQFVENLPVRMSLSTFLFDRDIPRGTAVRKESDTWHAVFTINVLSFEHAA